MRSRDGLTLRNNVLIAYYLGETKKFKETMIRTIVERLSRERVIKRTITVNGQAVPLYLSPDAQLKYLKLGKGAFDQDLINIAQTYVTPSSNVWDIGANVGVFTFSAASIATKGMVVAMEPDVWLASLLRRTARLPQHINTKIAIIPAAASNNNSVAEFIVAARGRASNALREVGGRSTMGGTRETQFVPTLTLDTLLLSFPAPDFIKIDIEGAELLALQGATKLMRDIRPIFYVEVGGDVSDEILKLFSSHSYAALDEQGRVLQDKCANNTFFIPKESESLRT